MTPCEGSWYGVRHTQVVLLFFLTALTYAMRTNLSVAIVAMTSKTTENPDIPFYHWNNKNVILSSFYWGYILPQIFAGYLSKIYGAKICLLIEMSISSICCILTPVFAEYGSYALIACRVLQGIAQGFVYPCIHHLLGVWVPSAERGRMTTVAIIGRTFGTIITMPVIGVTAASYFGWPFSFYLIGTSGIMWIITYFFLAADTPSTHPWITEEEKEYIELSLGQNEPQKASEIPWGAILTSPPFWATFIAFSGEGLASCIVLTEMPSYMSKIFNINIESNGLLSSLPYVACFLVASTAGPFSDYLINNQYISRTNARKCFTITGFTASVLTILALTYLAHQSVAATVICFILLETFGSFSLAGYFINIIDLSPNNSGVLMGICNTLSNSMSIAPPLMVQYMISDEKDQNEWRIIFLISIIPLVIASIFYGIFASSEKQWWDSGRIDNYDWQKQKF